MRFLGRWKSLPRAAVSGFTTPSRFLHSVGVPPGDSWGGAGGVRAGVVGGFLVGGWGPGGWAGVGGGGLGWRWGEKQPKKNKSDVRGCSP